MKRSLFILMVLCLIAGSAEARNPKKFADVCSGHGGVKNKQDYDFTYGHWRVLRTTYFCNDGFEEYHNTSDVQDDQAASVKSAKVTQKFFQQGVKDTDEIKTKEF